MTPAVAGETVYVGSCSGTYFALDLRSGEVRWRYDATQDAGRLQYHGDPVVTEDLVVTGSDSGTPSYTYAFERATGAVRWRREGAALNSDLSVIGGGVIGRTWNGDLVALSIETGDVLWRHTPAEYRYQIPTDASPMAADGTVYFGAADGYLYAVDGTGGESRWRTDLGVPVTTAPILSGSAVVVGTGGNALVSADRASGAILARFDLPGRPIGRLAVVDDRVVCLLGGTELVAVDRELKAVRWSIPAEVEWSSLQPLVWRHTVVVGNEAGEVFGFRASDGTISWTETVDGVVRGLGEAGDVVLVGTLAGTLYAIRPDTTGVRSR